MINHSANGCVLRVAGESGEGVITVGALVSKVAARVGLHLVTFRTFPAEIRGGPCMMQIRLSERPISFHGDRVDILVALNEPAIEDHFGDLAEGGALLYEQGIENRPPVREGVALYAVPFQKLAVEVVGNRVSKNIVALGALSQILQLPYDQLEGLIKERFARRGETVLANNLKGLEAGFAYAQEQFAKDDGMRLDVAPSAGRFLMTGNEAAALGALAAGMRYYFGYPITPSSEIMEYLAKSLPRLGGRFVQAEDEISAIAGVCGAAWAGAKAMTATSGPGLSLMSEIIGLLSMAEVPAVIVDAQRGGPSTGLPTKVEQSDLWLAVYGSHGDAPRIVIAPTTVEDTFRIMILGFNLAEKYQMPVIVLLDQALSSRLETVSPDILTAIKIINRVRPDGDAVVSYQRYRLTDSGISPMALPGTQGCEHMATGLEHDETGKPRYDDRWHALMSAKRHLKWSRVEKDPLVAHLSTRCGADEADIGIISWGSSAGPVEEAVALARRAGLKVKSLTPRLLNPLPHAEIKEFVDSVKKVIVPELNFSGQFAMLLRSNYLIPTISLAEVKGVPFSPREILEKIEAVAAVPRSGRSGGGELKVSRRRRSE